MAYESDSDMETVELSDVDADVNADAIADQVVGPSDPAPQTQRANDDYPSPPPSPDQPRRLSMAARMAANRESRLKKSKEDVSEARKLEEERQQEDKKRRRALEASAKSYQASLKSGKRKTRAPVKRNTQVIDDSDDDIDSRHAQSPKQAVEAPVRQSPMRKAKLKGSEAEPSGQEKDIAMLELPEPKPSPVRKTKRKVVRRKKTSQPQDGATDSAVADGDNVPSKTAKRPASQKRPTPARKKVPKQSVMDPDDSGSSLEEHSSDDLLALGRRGRQAPGSRITVPASTRPMGSPKSSGKLYGAAKLAKEKKRKRDENTYDDLEDIERPQDATEDKSSPVEQAENDETGQAALDEAEKLKRDQEAWRRNVREERKKKEDEKRKRAEEDAAYRMSGTQTARPLTQAREAGTEQIAATDEIDDDDDDDDVILVTTLPHTKRPPGKGQVPVASSASKEVHSVAENKKRRSRPKKTSPTHPEESSKRRKVADSEKSSRSKQNGPSSKSTPAVVSSGRKASVPAPNESGKGSSKPSQAKDTAPSSPLPTEGEHGEVQNEASNKEKMVDSPRRSALRSTKGTRKPASALSDGAVKKLRKGNVSAPEGTNGIAVESPGSRERGQKKQDIAQDAPKELNGDQHPDLQLVAETVGSAPANAQRARPKGKKALGPAPTSSLAPGDGEVASTEKEAERGQQGAVSLPSQGEKPDTQPAQGLDRLPESQIYVSEQEEVAVLQQLVYALETLDLQHVDLQEDLFGKALAKLFQRPGLARSTSLMEVDGEGLSQGVRQVRRRRELIRNIEAAKVALQSAQQQALVSFVQAVSASLEEAQEKGGGALGDMIRSKRHATQKDVFGLEYRSVRATEGETDKEKGGEVVAMDVDKGKEQTGGSKKAESGVDGKQTGNVVGGRSVGGKKSDMTMAQAKVAGPLPVFKTMQDMRSYVGSRYSSLNLRCSRCQAILVLCERAGGVERDELLAALPVSEKVFEARISELKKLGFLNEMQVVDGEGSGVMYSTVAITD